jgi:RND family efflux transporter MFP subunit
MKMQPVSEEPAKHRRTFLNRPSFIILGVLSIVIIVILFSIGFFERFAEKQGGNAIQGSTIPTVRVMIAEPESEEVPLTLPSFLVGYRVTPILARTSGYLKNFYVDIGDYVRAGQLLGEIDVPDVDAELPPAKSSLESLKAKLEIAKLTAERWTRLYRQDPDAVPKEEVDQTIAAYQSAAADVQAAQQTVDRLTVLQNFKYIYAPFDGVVVERNIEIGSLISAGNETLTQPYITGYEVLNQPLFQIASTDVLRAFVEVPQPYYPYIADGVKAEVHVPEYPNEVFTGIINRNAGALDQLSRTLLTQVNIENRKNLLRPGIYAEVKFLFKPYRNSFNIPIGALIIRNGPPFVALVKEEDMVFLQEVHIGRDFGKSVQIVKGLKEGDKVILNPNFRIKDGIKVKVTHLENKKGVILK